MEIPLKATVNCIDGECGQVSGFLINPFTNDLTHLIVEDIYFPNKERVVPIKYVEKTNSKSIQLSCDKESFVKMEDFKEHNFYPADKSYGIFPLRPMEYIPYSSNNVKYADVTRERIPVGEISFEIGASVEATDGKVGYVNEFLTDSDSEHITHIVMTEGHLWNKKRIAIPVSKIDHIEKNAVYLKINKDQIESLPIPLETINSAKDQH